MSIQKAAPQRPTAQPDKDAYTLEGKTARPQPDIERMDVAALQIDESYDEDCDPYNSTGQFLADALKKKYDGS